MCIRDRDITIRTIPSESDLRYRDWVEKNRNYVHRKTKNKTGYVHIPDMSPWGYSEFHRYWLSELQYDSLVVDVRFNGGGHVSQLILEKLARKRLGYDITRWMGIDSYPGDSIAGPIVAITNEYEIDGCVSTYVQPFGDLNLIAIYDFNKALWNSAASQIGEDGREYFILNGEVGVQEIYAYDADGVDATEGLWIFGLEPGPSTTIFFPILVDISRFENAMYDLMDECPGIKSKY